MTEFTIRPATTADHEYISSWTSETFSWGDYVGDAFNDWLEDEDGTVIVAEVGGYPVSLGRIRMVSESEDGRTQCGSIPTTAALESAVRSATPCRNGPEVQVSESSDWR